MRYYFAGQEGFGNRGCEALIRSIVALLKEGDPNSEFFCPSHSPDADRRQWPEAEGLGVQFIEAGPLSWRLKWWGRALRLWPQLARLGPPPYMAAPSIARAANSADLVIVTGGDIFSEEYSLPSIFHWLGSVDYLMKKGVPAVLWAASVGPFRQRWLEGRIVDHLKQYRVITVREQRTQEYLGSFGMDNVKLVSDPAFVLQPQLADTEEFTFGSDACLIGLNLSPLVEKLRGSGGAETTLASEVVSFVRRIARDEPSYKFLLIPHVDPRGGGTTNSDSDFLRQIAEEIGLGSDRLRLVPATLNAAQLKYIISQCRFFIGARTHATIAAFSTGVPTLSLAYSTKARGINEQLLGSEDYLLNIADLTSENLERKFRKLRDDEAALREKLKKAASRAATAARSAAPLLLAQIQK